MSESRNPVLLNRDLEKLPPAIANRFRQAMPLVPRSMHQRLLTLTGEVLTLSDPAASEFLKSCSFVVRRAGITGLESWCQEGLGILQINEQSGVTYFGLGMSRSTMLVEELSSGVELDSIRLLLEKYYLALTGINSSILSTSSLENYHIGQPAPGEEPNENSSVFLPDFVDRYPDKPGDFT